MYCDGLKCFSFNLNFKEELTLDNSSNKNSHDSCDKKTRTKEKHVTSQLQKIDRF